MRQRERLSLPLSPSLSLVSLVSLVSLLARARGRGEAEGEAENGRPAVVSLRLSLLSLRLMARGAAGAPGQSGAQSAPEGRVARAGKACVLFAGGFFRPHSWPQVSRAQLSPARPRQRLSLHPIVLRARRAQADSPPAQRSARLFRATRVRACVQPRPRVGGGRRPPPSHGTRAVRGRGRSAGGLTRAGLDLGWDQATSLSSNQTRGMGRLACLRKVR